MVIDDNNNHYNNGRLIKETYKQLYKRSLETDVKGDTSYNFKRLLVSMVNAGRQESDHNIHEAPKLAQELYKAGVNYGRCELRFYLGRPTFLPTSFRPKIFV